MTPMNRALMRILFFSVATGLLLLPSSALYNKGSAVEILTEKNFKELVLDSSDYWLVEFYAPWCGHCKSLKPEWEKAAKQLEDKVRVGAVDATVHEKLAQQYGIQGFPTIKEFGQDKTKPADYQGAREVKAIVDYALSKAGSATTSKAVKMLKYLETYSFLNFGSPTKVILFAKSKKGGKAPAWYTQLASKYAKDKKKKVDFGFVVSEEAKIPRQFGMRAEDLPTLIFCYAKSQVYTRFSGKVTEASTAQFVEKALADLKNKDILRDLTQIPNFPSPKVPRKKPRYSITELDAHNADKICFMGKKTCALLLSSIASDSFGGSTEEEVLKELAKRYRRDPITFAWMGGGDQAKIVAQTLKLDKQDFPVFIMLKTGRRARIAEFQGLWQNADARDFIDKVLTGDAKFKRVEISPGSLLQSEKDGRATQKSAEGHEVEHTEL